MNFKQQLLRYWLAMNATSFDSGVDALMVYGGMATVHQAAAEFNIKVDALTLQQGALVFLSAFGWAVLQYLHAHPLAQLLPAAPGPQSGEEPIVPGAGAAGNLPAGITKETGK